MRAALLAALILALLMPAAPVAAGTPADHPEFPYPATDYDEPFRGQFHFSSRSGWMNDPNGSFWYRGQYHLFYQHNPHGLRWDTMHWGHATSPDLVHWTQKPIALEPGVHPGDLWSGNGVVDTANVTGLKNGPDDPILVFSGTNGAIIHYSLDGARTFQTYARGGKVAVPSGTSRDPYVFWHAGSRRWVMVMWSDGGGNGADFFTSTDLLTWTWRSRFAAPWFFECPSMVRLPVDGDTGDQRWVLADASGEYVTGSFDGTTFRPQGEMRRMDYGANSAEGTFYAGQTFTGDPRRRVIQTAWQPAAAGSVWTGNLTFPVELGLRTFADGVRLTRTPIDELASLRSERIALADRVVTPQAPVAVARGDAYEIDAVFENVSASRFGLRLGGHDVVYDQAAQALNGAPLRADGGRITVRALVDRDQLEIFGNDGELSISDVVRFAGQDASVFSEGGDARLVSLSFNRLRSAWGTGEPTIGGNLSGPWTADGGTWVDVAEGKQGTAGGSYLNSSVTGDGSFGADVLLRGDAAAGLTVRDHYTASVDASGLVRLSLPGRVLGENRVAGGDRHHLEVVATGARLRVLVDHGRAPVIDVRDATYATGRTGATVSQGTAVIGNITHDATGFDTNLTGPWRPTAGAWTVPGESLRGQGSGDLFYLSGQTGADFTYQGDVRPVNGVAAGLTFRGSYTANVDVNGLVKLWRPGKDIAVFRTPIVPGRTYHLTVVAAGPSLRVKLNGREVIDTTDSAFASGPFGLNAYEGSAEFQNVRVTSS